jgi:outer membrane autotransporter protein
MKINVKQTLLVGTALVSAAGFGAAAQAANLTLGANSEWGASGTVAAPTAGDNVDLNSFDLTIDDTGDGTAVGAITDTGTPRDGDVIVTSDTGSADISSTIGSINIGGDFTVQSLNADDSTVAVTVSGATTVGGNLVVTNATENSAADTITLTLTGNATVTGTTGLTAGALAGGGTTATLNVDGATNVFTDAVTITGGAGNAANDANLVISGASTTFTGGLTLTDGAAGQAILTLDGGTTAQSITGVIGGNGDIVVTNSAGATFNGAVTAGSVTIEDATGANNSSATFKGAVTAPVTLGGAGTGTNTVTFDATSASYTVTGAVAGAIAGENNVVNIAGGTGKVVTFATAMGANVDDINIAANTTLSNTGGGAITSSTIDLSSGAELSIDAAATVTGDLNGAGTYDINENTVHVGDIGDVTELTTINIEAGNTLTLDADTADEDITVDAATIVLAGASAELIINSDDTRTTTIAGPLSTTVNSEGIITITGDDADENIVFSGNIGTSALHLDSLTTTTNATGADITFAGDVFIDAITGDNAADVFTFTGTNATVSGTIDGTAGGDADVVVGNGTAAANVRFDGELGVGQDLSLFKVSTLATATVTDDMLVTGTNAGESVNIDGTYNIDSSDEALTLDAVEGNFDIDGTVTITGDENVLMDANDAFSIDGLFRSVLTTAGDTLTINSDTSTVTLGGTSNTTFIAGNEIELSDELAIGATTVDFKIRKTSVFDPDTADVVDFTGAVGLDIATAGVLKVSIDEESDEINNGTEITVFDSGADTQTNNVASTFATQITAGRLVLQNTAFMQLTNTSTDAQDLKVTVNAKDASEVLGSDSVGVEAANTLLAINNADTTGTLEEAKGNLQTATTNEEAQQIAESLAPTVDGSGTVTVFEVSNAATNLTTTRLAEVRTDSTGVAAGNMGQGVTAWIQGFGQLADQDTHDGVAGYEADTYGFAVGMDSENISDRALIGLALSYANTDVDSDNANDTNSDIDSYQVTLYGDYDLDDATYLAGSLAYAHNNIDQARHNVGGIAGNTAVSDYDSNQYIARAELGRDYAVGTGVLTPNVNAQYQHIATDSYTETGAGTAGLNVDPDDVNVLEFGIGATMKWDMATSNGSKVVPALHAGYSYDVIGDEVEASSRFIGAGPAFNTQGAEPSQHSLNAGASLSLFTQDNMELTGSYDFEYKEDYNAHAGFVRAGVKF